MTKSNSMKEKISKEDLKVSTSDSSKLLAKFFNGVVIQIDEECIHES